MGWVPGRGISYTQFLPRAVRKESNVPKQTSSKVLLFYIYFALDGPCWPNSSSYLIWPLWSHNWWSMAWLRLKTQQNLQRQNASWYVEIWANLGLFNTHKKICVYHITPLRMKPSFMNHHSCFGCWFLFFSNFICEHHSGFALWLICGVCTNTPTYYIWELFKQSFLWQKESMDAIKSRHQKSLMMVLVMCAFRDSITIRYEHLTLSRSQKLWCRSYDYWLIRWL